MSIEIQSLSFIYNPGTSFEKKALDNVSLSIPKGTFVGLIGHTGSGKSTLIQHLNALLRPTSGKITFDGKDINADKASLKAVRQKIGLVFQYPEHQLFEMTCYKDVAFGPQNLGLSAEETDSRVKEALAIVGLGEEHYNKSPFELSGGQKRRVAIAGVLAMKPEVLILDEPTAGLDPKGRDEILSRIKEMHQRLGITVILVSHSMEDIARLVEKIIVMDHGQVVFYDTPRQVFTNANKLTEIGLAVPQLTGLMNLLKAKGFDVDTEIFNLDEAVEALSEIFKL